MGRQFGQQSTKLSSWRKRLEASVSGLSPLDLSERIAQALQKRGLLNDPDVIVWITKYAPKRIFLIGAVAKPTQISIPRHQSLTLSQAFAMAGGFTVSADRVNVRVIRRHPDDAKPAFLTVDATQIITEEHLEKDLALLDGDTVVVANEARIYILGRVSRPGSYLVSQSKERTFIKLLGLAGGFTDGARSKEVLVFLKQPDGTYQKKTINGRDMLERGRIEQDFSVSPGSIIFVPTRFL